jgi:hypothetical protein
VGFLVENVALGQVFFEYFGFLYQFSLSQMLHLIIIIIIAIRGGTIGQLVANIPSGPSLTRHDPTSPKKTKNESVTSATRKRANQE